MELILAIIGTIVATLTLVGTIFNFAVIRPLNAAITNLQSTIEDLHSYVNNVEEKRQRMAEELAEIRESTKNAHKRISEHGELISSLIKELHDLHD